MDFTDKSQISSNAKLRITEDFVDLVNKGNSYHSSISAENSINTGKVFTDLDYYRKMLCELENACGPLEGLKILEVGSGYGLLCSLANKEMGLDIVGVEPPAQKYNGRFEVSQVLLKANGISPETIVCGVGEDMPFPSDSFDVVFSFQVLEHVNDPLKVLKESYRVLKKNGTLYINAPNYNTWYEGHYHVFWWPSLPKWLAKLYVSARGRDRAYLDHLNFINQRNLYSWLSEITGRASIDSDFGLGDWQNRVRQAKLGGHVPQSARRLFRLGEKLGLLRFVAFMGGVFKWQDCLRVIIRK